MSEVSKGKGNARIDGGEGEEESAAKEEGSEEEEGGHAEGGGEEEAGGGGAVSGAIERGGEEGVGVVEGVFGGVWVLHEGRDEKGINMKNK